MTAAIDVIQYKKTAGDTDYPTKDSNFIDTAQPVIAAPQWPFSYAPATTTGLTLGYTGGQMLLDGVLTAISDGTVALSASVTNYIEATRTGTVSKNTTGFTAGQIPLYTVVTGSGAITSLTDVRAFNQPYFGRLSLATTGGTTALTYAQARVQAIDVTGALVSNATIEVPAAPWQWAINNGTSGAYTLTVKVNGQTGVTIPQGERRACICDATDVRALTGYVATDGDTLTGFLTLHADPTSALHAATKQYADGLVVGLLDDRGNHSASGDAWPSTGGSGTAGAILKGDLWRISVAGTLGGTAVQVGDAIRALVDTPGSTASNWGILEGIVIPASETASGIVELATTGEAQTGTDTARAVTPAGIAAATAFQGKQTVWIPAGAMATRTSNGAASGTTETTTNKVMVKTLDFDASTAEYAQFSVAMPKSWNGSTVTAQFCWSNVSGTGNVIWGLQGVAISDDDVLDAAFGTAQTVTDGVTAAGDLMQSAETGAITIGGTPASLDLVIFQVYRDAANGSDTLAVDARLHGVRLYITTNAKNDA